ncbi:3347_t:CDS:2 [Funneliformis caledonium]|uniref:3347_t:CDS:1 n=1 Tax=Funneliformis caledonium TaxID=1117310 RepID=A0A9N8VLM7_9GLOM|nr:3347_t:CDS:2 [Funneliformis caledonium]
MEKNLSEMEVAKLLNKLLVRTILKIRKVESNKSTKEKSHIITLEKTSIIGKELEKVVLFSRSEIQQNINQLENLNSYKNYFDILPKTICNFFQAFITVLQQLKQNVVNKKRLQHNPIHPSIVQQNTSSSSQQTSLSFDISHPKKLHHTTTNTKKAILDQLFEFEEKLPETAISKVLSELQTIFLDWIAERIKQYLRNNCHKVQK